jgi:hypothetical protein
MAYSPDLNKIILVLNRKWIYEWTQKFTSIA